MRRLVFAAFLCLCSLAAAQPTVVRTGGGWIEGEAFWFDGNQLQTRQFAGLSPTLRLPQRANGKGVMIVPSMQVFGGQLLMWNTTQIRNPFDTSLEDIIKAGAPVLASVPPPPNPDSGSTIVIYAGFKEVQAVMRGITTPLSVNAICISSARKRGRHIPSYTNSNYADSSGSMGLKFQNVQYIDSFKVENSFRFMFLPTKPQHCAGTVDGVTTHYTAVLDGPQFVTLSCYGDPVYYPFYFHGQEAIQLAWNFTKF